MECYSEDYISGKIGVLRPVLSIDEEQIWIEEKKALSSCTFGRTEYPFWDCHFIDNPVMPGTYMIEMMAQSAAFFEMILAKCMDVPIITSVSNVRFLREVKPDQVVFAEILLKKITGNYYTTQGKLTCAGKTVCKAEMVHYIK